MSGRLLHLRQPGQSGPHRQPPAVVGQGALELIEEFGAFGPGPDQAHLAHQDVDELGELIDVAPAEEPADRGDPGIAGDAPGRAAVPLAVLVHGPDLVDREDLPPSPSRFWV